MAINPAAQIALQALEIYSGRIKRNRNISFLLLILSLLCILGRLALLRMGADAATLALPVVGSVVIALAALCFGAAAAWDTFKLQRHIKNFTEVLNTPV